MKNIIGIIVAIAVIGLVWFMVKRGENTSPTLSGNLVTYADPEGVFTFQYPYAFNILGREGALMATVNAPNGEQMLIRWSNEPRDIANCDNGEIYDGDCWRFLYGEGEYEEEFRAVRESFEYLVSSD